MRAASRLRCGGCGWQGAPGEIAHHCPRAGVDGADHVLIPVPDADVAWPDGGSINPFVRYRDLLHAYAHWAALGGTEAGWEDLVEELDSRVAAVDGQGFRITPVIRAGNVVAKDETGNVAGSHKGRHLFGTLLALEAGPRLGGPPDDRPLAIASCGNAALAAAVLAAAARRPLQVYVPEWGDPAIVERLVDLDASVVTCPRRAGERGDPCVLRFREAVTGGAVPFSCQGTDNALALDGGRTLGWELADQLPRAGVARVVVQVGGGALASSLFRALEEAADRRAIAAVPRLHAVQAAGAAPLVRAWDLLATMAAERGWEPTLALAAADRSGFMWPWDSPQSSATGILDDETYDWLEVVRGAAASGGGVSAVSETDLEAATAEARSWTVDVGPTGAAGLAGARRVADAAERVAVVLTGHS
jgi:threonine synthase